jgi:ParB family chromosome partitioning protein
MTDTSLRAVVSDFIEVKLIRTPRYVLRERFEEISDLAASIDTYGLLEPILVRPQGGFFEIVAGHRRFLACKSLRWSKIPCVIQDLSDEEAYEASLSENIQRKSLNPIEEARAFKRYTSEFGWGSISKLAQKIGKSQEYVSNRIRLLNLPDEIVAKVISREISQTAARDLLKVKDESKQKKLASEISSKHISTRKLHAILETDAFKDSFPAWHGKELPEKSLKVLKKLTLVMRLAMYRTDNLLEEAKDPILRELIMHQRQVLHSLVDESIKLALKEERNRRHNIYLMNDKIKLKSVI